MEGYRKHSLRLARLAWLGGEGNPTFGAAVQPCNFKMAARPLLRG